MRALFYRGRHHVRTAPRPADGGLVTVDTITSRLRAEWFWAWRDRAWATRGSVSIRIVPDVRSFEAGVTTALSSWADGCARAKAEGLGGLAV